MTATLNIAEMQTFCEYIYVGLKPTEALQLMCINKDDWHTILLDPGIQNLGQSARIQAKLDLLSQIDAVAKGESIPFSSMQMLKHALSTRFGLTEDRYERKQRKLRSRQELALKREQMQQWSDHTTAKMVGEATNAQLDEWAKST